MAGDIDQAGRAARASLKRTAVVFTPLLLLSLAGTVIVIINLAIEGPGGLIITLVLLLAAAFLTGHQSIQALRDLLSSPEDTTGAIQRRWSRADMFVLRSYYIFVENSVYKVDSFIYEELREGDAVTIKHYPHTNTVISVEVQR